MDERPPNLNVKIVKALYEFGPMTPEQLAEKVEARFGAKSIYASLSGMGPPHARSGRHYVDPDGYWSRKATFRLTEDGVTLAQVQAGTRSVLDPLIQKAARLFEVTSEANSLAKYNLDMVVEARVREINPEIGDINYSMSHGCTGPLGLCVYDLDEDPAEDDCVFCHQPWERK